MSEFSFLFKQIMGGRSIARAFFNNAMRSVCVRGKIADIGAGTRPYYHQYMQKEQGAEFVNLDRLAGDETNFETDRLPYKDSSFDTVLSMNVLEHIYNHKFHFSELVRIIQPSGKLVLFVPFLYMYHANHNDELLDCYRYTKDTLSRLSEENGLLDIKVIPVSRAMMMASLNMVSLSIPRIIRIPLFCIFYAIDGVILRIRPNHRDLFPLGYVLEAKKL